VVSARRVIASAIARTTIDIRPRATYGFRAMFSKYLTRWQLTPDGDLIVTRSSRLLPVRRHGVPAMLKVAMEAEEKFGGLLMSWWNGKGAARVLAQDGDALLLERAMGHRSLANFAKQGRDDEASRVICAVVAKLHTNRGKPPPDLIPLTQWFRELEPAAKKHGGILALSAATARELLADPQDVVALHGRHSSRQYSRLRCTWMAGHRSETPPRRARLRLCQPLL